MTWPEHWWEFLTGAAGLGGVGLSIRYFPRFWRGIARALAAPILLEIEREKLRAREEQVADLVDQIEAMRHDRDSRGD